MIVNLISDTVTKPTKSMLTAMLNAEVGDDVFGDDPTVNALEEKASIMFNMQSALFCPSGTMTNQLAIKIHTNPLDEMICDHLSHVYQYENGGYAFHSGIAVNPLIGKHGKITAQQIKNAIKKDYDWLPNTKLVVIENTCNKGGGSYYDIDEMKSIAEVCKSHNLKLHLDGARLFNSLVETKEDTETFGSIFDSISICLSKGLGAPVGSLLIGCKDDIKKARRFRKVFGGGMRQTGYLAAAGMYALDHNIERLKIDNDRAKAIGTLLQTTSYVKNVLPVHSNIIIFELTEKINEEEFLSELLEHKIHAVAFGPQTIRFVFHLDINEKMMEHLKKVLLNF